MQPDAAQVVQGLIGKRLSVTAGMHKLIAVCEQRRAAGIWQELRELDFTSDARQLSLWLHDLLHDEPPSAKINGFYFGLFTAVVDRKKTCCLYLSGSTDFQEREDNDDWACEQDYWPEGRYAPSQVLATIYRLTAKKGSQVASLGEEVLCFGFAALLVAAWCRGAMKRHLLGTARKRGIAVGFDDGDILRINVLRKVNK